MTTQQEEQQVEPLDLLNSLKAEKPIKVIKAKKSPTGKKWDANFENILIEIAKKLKEEKAEQYFKIDACIQKFYKGTSADARKSLRSLFGRITQKVSGDRFGKISLQGDVIGFVYSEKAEQKQEPTQEQQN